MKPVTPQPVVVTTICSECGLAWESHGDKPTTSDCIRLLKIELAKRPVQPYIYPTPIYPQYPNYLPYRVWYSNTAGGQYAAGTAQNFNCNTATPAISVNSCSAVSA
jgi:hypothetical protein